MKKNPELTKKFNQQVTNPRKEGAKNLLRNLLYTFGIIKIIHTEGGKKLIIMKDEKGKYRIEGNKGPYNEIMQLPDRENIKVKGKKGWGLLGPDLSLLLKTKYESVDHQSYEGRYIVTYNGNKEIIYKGKNILKTKEKYNKIKSRNLRNLGLIFLAMNTGDTKNIEENGEIKKFVETTIFDKNGKKMLGPTNIICINNKPVIDSIEGGLLVKTDSGRIITQDNENPIILEDIILRYINKKPTIIGYKQNGKRHKKEKAPYFSLEKIKGKDNAA